MPSIEVLPRPQEEDLIEKQLPEISDYPLTQFDKGIFASQLLQLGILEPQDSFHTSIDGVVGGRKNPESTGSVGNVKKGTFMGTKIALDQLWKLVGEA